MEEDDYKVQERNRGKDKASLNGFSIDISSLNGIMIFLSIM